MNTYYQLTTYFKQQLDAIEDVREVLLTDTIKNKFEVADYKTALAVVDVQPNESGDSYVAYNVRIECVDFIDVSDDEALDSYIGNNNVIDIYNSTLAVVRRIHLQLRHKTTQSNQIQIEGVPTFEKLFDASQNVAGTAINMVVNIDDAITNLCE